MRSRLNLLAPEVRADPYPFYAELRRHAPLCQIDPGGRWAITRYEDVMYVLKNPRLFSSVAIRYSTQPAWLGRHNPFSESMFVMDPPEHGRLRTLVSRAFTPGVISRLEERIRAFARDVITALPMERSVNFVEAFAQLLPARTIGELLGLDASLHSRFKRWADDIVTLGSISPEDTARHVEVRASIAEMEQHLESVLEQRRSSPGQDLMSELLRVRVDGEALSHRELMAFFFMLLVGGLETTVHVLGHSARMLMERPELMDRLHADRSLIPRFVEEMVRYEPPLHGAVRLTTTEVELAGARLPAGEVIFAVLASACRDEAYCPDGERFDMNRTGPQNLAFGHGAHFCLGAALARLQVRVGLEELLGHCRRLSAGEGSIEWNASMIARGPTVLPVVLHRA
jgi:cytochrome P450